MLRRSLAFSFLDRYAGILLNVGTMAIVSRLLTPAEIGLFMVGAAVVILVETFRDFGVTACIVQEKDLNRDFVRTAFTIILLLSLALAGILYLAAGVIARFYEAPELVRMVRFACLAFLLAPFGNALLALMRRDMAFDRVARVSISAAAANALTTITLAAHGFGAMSFVYASVLGATVQAGMAIWLRPEFWVFRPSLGEWRRVLPFGAWSTLVTILSVAYDFMPRLILGRMLGFDAVGLFSRALTLCQLPERALVNAMQPVALSAMAAHARAGTSLREPYLLSLTNLAAVQWPALVCLALLAQPVVAVLLGAQWLAMVPLVRIIALALLAAFPLYMTFPVLAALGRLREMLVVNLLTLPASTLVLYLASRVGLHAVALSLLLTTPFQSLVAMLLVRRYVPFAWSEIASIAARAGVVTVFTAAIPAGLAVIGDSVLPPLVILLLAGVGAAAGWGLGLASSGHPLGIEVAAILRRMRRREASPELGAIPATVGVSKEKP